MEDWITTAEASELSGFHQEYIRRLSRKGLINAKKWGREWMVDKNSLIEYLDMDRRPGPKANDNGGSKT